MPSLSSIFFLLKFQFSLADFVFLDATKSIFNSYNISVGINLVVLNTVSNFPSSLRIFCLKVRSMHHYHCLTSKLWRLKKLLLTIQLIIFHSDRFLLQYSYEERVCLDQSTINSLPCLRAWATTRPRWRCTCLLQPWQGWLWQGGWTPFWPTPHQRRRYAVIFSFFQASILNILLLYQFLLWGVSKNFGDSVCFEGCHAYVNDFLSWQEMLILKQIAYQSLQESKRDNAGLSSDNAKTHCRERADPTVRDPLELASPTKASSAIRFPSRHQPTKNKKRIMSH